MLRNIRDNLNKWVIGVLLLLVAVPLVFMGLGDYQTSSESYAFKIGDKTVSSSRLEQEIFQYKQALLRNNNNQIPPVYTDEFIRDITIDYMIRTMLLDDKARSLNLVFHNNSIVDKIMNTSAFRNENGFDKDLYLSQLYKINMSPESYEGYIYQSGITQQLKKAITDSGKKIEEIDAVASTAGPGLIVCLSVGLSFGKAFASAINKPFIAVNHLEGHALSPKLNSHLNYPYLLLLISGGHSQYLSVQGLGKYKRLGTTIDDALGEAFDKTAKLLGIEFPGGPQIEVLAKKGDPEKYDLPKPIFNKGGCNLSFAGLKTAILKITKSIKTDQEKFDLAASFQKTVEEILIKKTQIAFEEFEKENKLKEKIFVVAGGVAANRKIRSKLISLCEANNYKSIFPPIELCGDNAAMIAMVGLEKYKLNKFNNLNYPAKPRWPLDNKAAFLKGAGVKF